MKFLIDQSTDARLVTWLTDRGHNAIRIGRDYPPGLPDEEVLAMASRERRILITDDRDFGGACFPPAPSTQRGYIPSSLILQLRSHQRHTAYRASSTC